MERKIKKVAVLGSGVMGSRIACHFANVGLQVLLLDLPPKQLTDKEKKQGLSLQDKAVRNRVANEALEQAVKSNPSPLYDKAFLKRIKTGNFEDHMQDVASCDWILEAVVEDINIKKKLFGQVEEYRTDGTLITSNTSGIPINQMLEERSEDFQKHFCGTHFFNPPRYLRLLEIIPSEKTLPEVIQFLLDFGDLHLGKATVRCKDTPAFIANRVGVYSMMDTLHLKEELGLRVDEVDALTGTVIGRPKSATFRTADVVGLDTLIKVADNLHKGLKNDEGRETFKVPDYLRTMVEEKGWKGDKSGQGFFQKTRDKDGNRLILALNTETLDYEEQKKAGYETLKSAKKESSLQKRFTTLMEGNDTAATFYRKSFGRLFAYVSNRVPEIADELYKIDDAMRAGFGWEMGPFEIWDALGVQEGLKLAEEAECHVGGWVYKMVENGCEAFYTVKNKERHYYDLDAAAYEKIPGIEKYIMLDTLRREGDPVLWENDGVTLFDLGDGILNLEFHTKMNTINNDVMEGCRVAMEKAEEGYEGMVVGNEAANFSAGADLGMLLELAKNGEYSKIEEVIKRFQEMTMRFRYSPIPVVIAPHGMTLGGGCEVTLHGDHVQAAAETYMGLVEFGAGVIPAGGGTKEMVLRTSDRLVEGNPEVQAFRNIFMMLGQAQVSGSAHEAKNMMFLKKGNEITLNKARLIREAKRRARDLADNGYVQPGKRDDIKVPGQDILGAFESGIEGMLRGNYITEYDCVIARNLAWVISGGDISGPTTVSEDYLLKLEREAFTALTKEEKTRERMEGILKTGKPVRN